MRHQGYSQSVLDSICNDVNEVGMTPLAAPYVCEQIRKHEISRLVVNKYSETQYVYASVDRLGTQYPALGCVTLEDIDLLVQISQRRMRREEDPKMYWMHANIPSECKVYYKLHATVQLTDGTQRRVYMGCMYLIESMWHVRMSGESKLHSSFGNRSKAVRTMIAESKVWDEIVYMVCNGCRADSVSADIGIDPSTTKQR